MGDMRMLPPFSEINANVPFNVLVMPGKYSVKVAAEKSVADALQTNVTDGLLTLTTNASFASSQPIKVTVMLPAGNLTSANVIGSFDLVIGSGFRAKNISVTSMGAATVSATNITASSCVVSARGTSWAAINGTCDTADVSASGASSAYVGSVKTSATANAGGTSEISVVASSPDVQITAALLGVSSVTYNQGQCTGDNSFLSSCDQGPVKTPPLKDTWTCGIKVAGTSQRGFWTSDGAIIKKSSGKLVRDGNGVTIISPQACEAAAPAPTMAMGHARSANAHLP
ncbi:hypothetical protein WJX81_004703 [Elliptochloris bilobata]|uniref:Putative auto-transporter adhesin head GIN domain-containing protein n=1 Tax=Elliptochloris bilobata TaxID=381761 RepID=A0AAW1RNZ9_9CHLO